MHRYLSPHVKQLHLVLTDCVDTYATTFQNCPKVTGVQLTAENVLDAIAEFMVGSLESIRDLDERRRLIARCQTMLGSANMPLAS